MKHLSYLGICAGFVAVCMTGVAVAAPKKKDTLDPQCEQKEKIGISECKERKLTGSALKACLDAAKYEAYEVLVINGKKKREGHYCEREDKIKDRYGEKCVTECPKGVTVLSRSLVQSGMKVKECRNEKSESYVVACREESKDDKKKPSDEKADKDKERLRAAEDRVLGGTPHDATHYDCAGMKRSSVCYGGDGRMIPQNRMRDGDVAIPESMKSQYGLNYGDKVLLQDTKTGRQTWVTVRDTNANQTIDFFREYSPSLGRSVRESTPMQELGYTYGTTYQGRTQLRVVQIDRTGRHN